MIYIKGVLVGTLTLVLSVITYFVIWTWFMARKYAALVPAGDEITLDLRSLLYSISFWLVAVAGFALGFSWILTVP
jgi:hypothetical protein